LVKRFWKTVTVENGTVLLDNRPVKTPGRITLALPTPQLAKAVADEWRAVGDEIKPHEMPLTRLANAAAERAPKPDTLAVYGETDLLCYRAENPPELAAREAEIWDPLLDWARLRFDVSFTVTSGIIHAAQPPETVKRLGTAVAAYDDWHRTALSPLVTIGGSLVVALMLAEGAITPDNAFDACHLDELWQAELWGEDWMATDARALRRADFSCAARFLSLLSPTRSG
jgi:chaperone required for assembly of F1-ATPase